MDLSTRSVESVDQSVVETVEVVAGSESVLSPGGTETGLKIIAPGQLSVPSSGVSFRAVEYNLCQGVLRPFLS